MKTAKGTLLVKTAILTWGLMLGHSIWAQTYTTVHSFTVGAGGSSPEDGLVLSRDTLYGTAYFEALNNLSAVIHGTVFAVNSDGTAFTNLHSFSPYYEMSPTNSDGDGPLAGLTLAGGRLYGTTVAGGNFGNGTLFAINTDGTAFTVLHDFNSGTDGSDVRGRLVLSGNMLYGTAGHGGSADNGTVFALSTNGTGFTVLHTFSGGNDGASPYGTLTLSGNTLYGTATFGGGTVFSLNEDGTGFKVLHTFTTSSQTNSDGTAPFGGLILSGNTLYGSASRGGSGGNGTLFALNTDGTGFTILHNFTATPPQNPAGGSLPATNIDGATPRGELFLSNNTLYGTASRGGIWGWGTLFAINTDGKGFTVLHTFNGRSEGSPNGGLVLLGNTLYGTTTAGGGSGDGTVFSISVSPQPTIIPSGSTVILSWPTDYAGFNYSGYTLQSTTNLASGIWTTNVSAPAVIKGRNTVTCQISRTLQFFRLSQ